MTTNQAHSNSPLPSPFSKLCPESMMVRPHREKDYDELCSKQKRRVKLRRNNLKVLSLGVIWFFFLYVFGCLFLDNSKPAYSLRNTYWCTVPQRFLLAYKTSGHQGLDYEEKSSHSAQVYGLWVVYKPSYPQDLFHRTQAVNLKLEKFYRPLALSTLITVVSWQQLRVLSSQRPRHYDMVPQRFLIAYK